MGFNRRDTEFITTKALPASAGSVNAAGFDVRPSGDLVADCEMLISAPALTTTELPDTETMSYKVEDSADNITFALVADSVLVQTGAGAAGAVAATQRFRFPTDVKRYVRVTATGSTNIGDCSGKSLTQELLF